MPASSSITGSSSAEAAAGPVTIVVRRTPRIGREPDLEAWLHGVGEAAGRFAGHLGLTVLRPEPPGRAYTLLFRFDTPDHLAAWDESAERGWWVARAEAICESTERASLSGLETWFSLPGGAAVRPPPRWKMAVVSFAVSFPTIQILGATLGGWLAPLPALLRGAAVGLAMILTMTYLGMPLATRLLRRWLYPATRG